jgi:hypothetical protein
MKKLFTFRPATIGTAVHVCGAELFFFYALHSIPCIGFIARFGDKSIYFSGDTFYAPDKIRETYVDKGNVNKKFFK